MRPNETYRAARRNEARTVARKAGIALSRLWSAVPRRPVTLACIQEPGNHPQTQKEIDANIKPRQKETPIFVNTPASAKVLMEKLSREKAAKARVTPKSEADKPDARDAEQAVADEIQRAEQPTGSDSGDNGTG